MSHSDIKTNSLILRLLPYAWRPYALLMRLDRPIGVWLLVLPGWWAIMLAAGSHDTNHTLALTYILLFGVGAIVMRGAGCVINDLWDRDLDAKVERTKSRPLASGAITPGAAILFLCTLLGLGLLILVQLNTYTIILGILSLPLVASYPLMKRLTFWPQAYLGLVFNFSALMGWSAIYGDLGPEIFVLYVSCIFWTLGYDTVYACQDKEDDLLVGIKSTALLFGEHVRFWVSGFYLLSFTGMTLSLYMVSHNLLAISALLPAGVHLLWQLKTWDTKDQQSSLRIFKSNRNFGVLVLAGIIVSSYVLAS